MNALRTTIAAAAVFGTAFFGISQNSEAQQLSSTTCMDATFSASELKKELNTLSPKDVVALLGQPQRITGSLYIYRFDGACVTHVIEHGARLQLVDTATGQEMRRMVLSIHVVDDVTGQELRRLAVGFDNGAADWFNLSSD